MNFVRENISEYYLFCLFTNVITYKIHSLKIRRKHKYFVYCTNSNIRQNILE